MHNICIILLQKSIGVRYLVIVFSKRPFNLSAGFFCRFSVKLRHSTTRVYSGIAFKISIMIILNFKAVCGLRGYLWSPWVLVVYVGTCGLRGYLWSTWVLVVYVGTCFLRGYLRSTWVLVVSVGTCGLRGYLWSMWVLVVSMGTCGLRGYRGLSHFPPKFKNIFVVVITFPPFLLCK